MIDKNITVTMIIAFANMDFGKIDLSYDRLSIKHIFNDTIDQICRCIKV